MHAKHGNTFWLTETEGQWVKLPQFQMQICFWGFWLGSYSSPACPRRRDKMEPLQETAPPPPPPSHLLSWIRVVVSTLKMGKVRSRIYDYERQFNWPILFTCHLPLSECYAEVHLVCNEYERTQFSKCVCMPGYQPHSGGSLTCVPPLKLIPVGGKCNPNATEEEGTPAPDGNPKFKKKTNPVIDRSECQKSTSLFSSTELCDNELSYCGGNGTCICGDDGQGSVLYDSMHKDCYLKSQPRTHNFTDSDRRQAQPDPPTLILTVTMVSVLSILIASS